MRRLPALAALSATALLAAGCGQPAESDVADSDDRGVELEDLETVDPTSPPNLDRPPEPSECADLSTPPDGVYTVDDAGTATVALEDEALEIVEVEPAEGWEYEVTQQDDAEVVILFTGPEDEPIALKVTVIATEQDPTRDDFTAQICTDVPA